MACRRRDAGAAAHPGFELCPVRQPGASQCPGHVYAGLDAGAGQYTTHAYASDNLGESWEQAGHLFMADAIHDFTLTAAGDLFAATGDISGQVLRTTVPIPNETIYLPLILR